jgi:hypothetical protein
MGWKLYAVALGLLLCLMYPTVMLSRFRPIYLLDLPITLLAYLGLVGYAFRRKLGSRHIWKGVCVVFVGWEFVFNFFLSSESLEQVGIVGVALWMAVLLVPEYVALWRYGYRSQDLWNYRE